MGVSENQRPSVDPKGLLLKGRLGEAPQNLQKQPYARARNPRNKVCGVSKLDLCSGVGFIVCSVGGLLNACCLGSLYLLGDASVNPSYQRPSLFEMT